MDEGRRFRLLGSGTDIEPRADKVTNVFAQLFLEGRPDMVEAQARRLADGQSILDAVRGQAKKLEGVLGAQDREKLDEYFTSVRELEQRLVQAEAWSKKPKPKVETEPRKLCALVLTRSKHGSNGIPRSEAQIASPLTRTVPGGSAA